MSEESSPPKKVGSLRDRIAQFEQKPTQPVAQVARTSAPQKNWAWKQKQAEVSSNPAPPPPAAASTSAPRPPTPPSDKEGDASTKASGMSASDARSSISQGGSLKERMAALQGRGAFGAPSSNAPPPPPPDGKPRVWKKAVVPHIPAAEPNSEEQQADAANITDSHPAEETEETREGDESVDPEEEERQRRANIAARMARLGGARVGMGPPVFSKKPAVVRRESEPENDGSSVKSVPIAIADPGPARKASLEAAAAVELPRSPPEHEEPSIHEELNRETRSLASPPSSPKRPRPPVPRSRSTSPASKPPVKETHRSQVISQESGDEEERGRRGVEEDPGAFAMEEEADDEAAGETYSTDPKRGRSNSSKLKAEGRSERQGTEDSETFSNAPPPVPKSTRPASPQFLPPPVPSKEGMNRLAGPKRAAPPRKKKVVQSPAGNEAELETEKTPAIDPAIITDEIPEGERSASKDIVTGDDDHTRLSDDENKREPDSVAHKQTLATSIDKDDDETAAGQPADLGYDGHDNANKLDRGLKQGDVSD